jgi:uncharacterized protein YciI
VFKGYYKQMQPKTVREKTDAARQLEKAGKLADAAVLYQQMVDTDPANRDAIGRLLVMYRKLKEYRKELAVINTALSAWQQRGKTQQDKWLREHPGAAGAGRSILRTLTKGGDSTAVFGSDAVVEAWVKRKAFVNKRLKGKKSPGGYSPTPKKTPADKTRTAARKKAALAAAKKEAAFERKTALAAKKEAAAAKKKAALERKAAAAARKAEAPSLFIISIRYLVSLEKLATAMPQHVAYLNKHLENGDFLVAGRQVPRTGGIIIARGKNLAVIEKMVKTDPFVKKKMADTEIVEFSASMTARSLKRWLTAGRN